MNFIGTEYTQYTNSGQARRVQINARRKCTPHEHWLARVESHSGRAVTEPARCGIQIVIFYAQEIISRFTKWKSKVLNYTQIANIFTHIQLTGNFLLTRTKLTRNLLSYLSRSQITWVNTIAAVNTRSEREKPAKFSQSAMNRASLGDVPTVLKIEREARQAVCNVANARRRGNRSKGKGTRLEYGFQNITQTFMHEGITKWYRCYSGLIEDLFIL